MNESHKTSCNIIFSCKNVKKKMKDIDKSLAGSKQFFFRENLTLNIVKITIFVDFRNYFMWKSTLFFAQRYTINWLSLRYFEEEEPKCEIICIKLTFLTIISGYNSFKLNFIIELILAVCFCSHM